MDLHEIQQLQNEADNILKKEVTHDDNKKKEYHILQCRHCKREVKTQSDMSRYLTSKGCSKHPYGHVYIRIPK